MVTGTCPHRPLYIISLGGVDYGYKKHGKGSAVYRIRGIDSATISFNWYGICFFADAYTGIISRLLGRAAHRDICGYIDTNPEPSAYRYAAGCTNTYIADYGI